ncbi:uncharacterized protein LOC112639558 [Camponotus floridanus]|uniref:uncharacterized protein LOC112639558 n=1 Tax=Camponotus floridanus TaxID=104421 RepID=UPI000DC6AC65|nr:uncharacterized protein LOC112639558 [Camponotus floridanus]
MIETDGSLNETSRHNVNDQIAEDTNFNGKFGNVIESTKDRTLIDFKGPAIIDEGLDNKSDQNFADHVRVKRSEPINDSIIRHQLNMKLDSFSQNSRSNNDTRNVYGDLMSNFKDSYVNPDRRNRSNTTIVDVMHSRHKRGVLSETRQRGECPKRSVRQSKYRVAIKNRKKRHDTLKSPRKPGMKKANNSSTFQKARKKTKIIPAKTMDESQIEKRESGTDNLNTDFVRTSITDYDKEENAVASPFVQTGRAELRVRIEKIPRNESSLISNWTDHSIGTTTCSTALLKYNDDEIVDKNATNFQLVPNFDSVGRGKVNNLTVEIIVKKLDYGSNIANRQTNDSASLFNYSESHPIESDLSSIKDSGKYNRVETSLDEDAKSRAKRNQEITSGRYLRSDRNALIGSKRFKNGRGTSIEDVKREKSKHKPRGNRAVRSIEEIKELAEKLIIKVNELQVYVSDRNETTTNICVDKNANRLEGKPKISSEKKRLAKVSKSEIANNPRHLASNSGQVTSAGKRESSRAVSSSDSRFARGENPIARSKSRRKWGRWMDWSSCSVTCGKGRQIRWRHCLHDCTDAETEMEEKACQLPACPPGKFLGIFR